MLLRWPATLSHSTCHTAIASTTRVAPQNEEVLREIRLREALEGDVSCVMNTCNTVEL